MMAQHQYSDSKQDPMSRYESYNITRKRHSNLYSTSGDAKLKENQIPSYLRGTTSSNNRAEHNIKHSRSKSNNLKTSKSTTKFPPSAGSTSRSAPKPDLIVRTKASSDRKQQQKESQASHREKSKSRSKSSNSTQRKSRSARQSTNSTSTSNKSASSAAASHMSDKTSSDTVSEISVQTHDIDIMEALKNEIPSEYINLDDGSFQLPSAKSSSLYLSSPATTTRSSRRPSKTFSPIMSTHPATPTQLKSKSSAGALKKAGFSTPVTSFENSPSSQSPSRLRPPSVSVRKREVSLEYEKKRSPRALAINLNPSSDINKSTSSANISITKKKSGILKQPSVLVPSKRQDSLSLKKSSTTSGFDNEISFLKEYSFDSEMTHLFDDLNLSLRQEQERATSPTNMSETSKIASKSNKTPLGKSNTTANLSKYAGHNDIENSPDATCMSTGFQKLKHLPHNSHTSKSRDIKISSTDSPINTSFNDDNFENKSCLSLGLDSLLENSLGKVKGNFDDNDNLKPHKSYSNHHQHTKETSAKTNVSAQHHSVNKSMSVQNFSGKSIGKIARGDKQKVDRGSSKRLIQNIRTYTSHPNNHKIKSPKLSAKIQDSNELFEALYTCKVTSKLVKSSMRDKKESYSIVKGHPMSPHEIKKQIDSSFNPEMSSLCAYERAEIMRKSSIYHIRNKKTEARSLDMSNFKKNFGFDDYKKDYVAIVGDHIDYRYEILEVLGSGSFGNVLKCRDHKTGKIVAIKIIKNDTQWSFQAVYEIKVLKTLSNNAAKEVSKMRNGSKSNNFSILKYLDHFNFRSHMCIVTELLSVDLFQAIQASNYNGFSLEIISKWCSQIMEALKFIHSHNIIHCDMKPENIMLTSADSLDIKIIDFGSSCYVNETSYSYIQSRFYRAPEVLIGARYSTAIDIWSAGCILAELFTGEPLFGGSNEAQQLALMIELLGPPKKEVIQDLRYELKIKGPVDEVSEAHPKVKTLIDTSFDKIGNLKQHSMNPDGKKRYSSGSKSLETQLFGKSHKPRAANSHSSSKNRSYNIVLNELESSFVDFIQSCLNWDPCERIEAESLMQHEFLCHYIDNEDRFEANIN